MDVDFDVDIGEFGFSLYCAGFNLSRCIGDWGLIIGNIGFGVFDYDVIFLVIFVVNDVVDIGAGFDDVYELEIVFIYVYCGEGKWFYLFGVGIFFFGEDGADFGDIFDFFVIVGFCY